MMIRTVAIAAISLGIGLTLAVPSAHADEVILDNGNAITGKVVDLAGDNLTVTSNYAEPIKIKKAHVRKITTDGAVELHLASGEIVKGRLKTADDGSITVEQGEGRVASGIAWNAIVSINPPPLDKWHGNVSLSGNLQSGNTDRKGVSFEANAVRRGEKDRFTLGFLYNIQEEDSKLTTRNAYGTLQYDYFMTKKLYDYLGVQLLNDKFKDLNLRTVVGPGLGYQVLDDPVKSLSLELGITYYSEDHIAHDDRHWFAARLAINAKHKLTDWLVFTDQLQVYPSVQKASDVTLRNEAAFLTAIGAGWSLKVANVLDYVSNPTPGVKSTDSTTTVGLQYAF